MGGIWVFKAKNRENFLLRSDENSDKKEGGISG